MIVASFINLWAALPIAWCVMNEDMMTEAERASKLAEPTVDTARAGQGRVLRAYTRLPNERA